MSFYRIYRPKVFAEIDNAKVRKTLESLLTKDTSKLPHAFLFSGPHGTGKTTSARLIAKLYNCEKPEKSGAPCGVCDACVAISGGNLVDVLEIDAASNTGVDNIRDLREKISLAPARSKKKIYIIDEVHMLSTGAFNALLKTLEEPPGHAVFILATTDVHKVPATIQSRCLHITFSKPSPEEILPALQRIVKAEKIRVDTDALTEIARLSDGSFRDAVKLLEQASFSKKQITAAGLSEHISLSDLSLEQKIASSLLSYQQDTALEAVRTAVTTGMDIKAVMTGVLTILHEALLKRARDEQTLSDDTRFIHLLIEKLTDAFGKLKFSPIAELPFELAIVQAISAKDSEKTNTQPAPSVQKPLRADAQNDSKPADRTISDDEENTDADDTSAPAGTAIGLITIEKLSKHWADIIEDLKPFNHSIAGVMRSARPKSVGAGVVTIEAFYQFHHEKLSETRTKEAISKTLKKLFGEKATVQIVLGKK